MIWQPSFTIRSRHWFISCAFSVLFYRTVGLENSILFYIFLLSMLWEASLCLWERFHHSICRHSKFSVSFGKHSRALRLIIDKQNKTFPIPCRAMTILGLVFIALGSGGIKPCVAAFGGDQFKLPEQAKQIATFFSLFYFAINSGSLISTSITPILRQDVSCYDQDDCYSLAFGVPGVLMIVSIFIFIFGKFLYKITPPAGNMVVLVSKCIGVSAGNREIVEIKKKH